MRQRFSWAMPRNCVFGLSYGGYAALMLAAKEPELYRCAVSFAGLTDLNLFIQEKSDRENKKDWFVEHVGDPEKDYDKLKSISPLYRIKDLNVPVLVMHGDSDTQVSTEHYYRFKSMSEYLGKKYQFELLSETGHSWESPGQAFALYSKAVRFMIEALGQQ